MLASNQLDSQRLRDSVLKGLCLGMMLLSAGLSYINLVLNGRPTVALAEAAMSVFSASLYLLLLKQKQIPTPVKLLYLICLTAVIEYVLFVAKNRVGMSHWLITLPIIFYLTLGKRWGFVLSLFLLAGHVVLLSAIQIETGGALSKADFVNFSFSFVVTWIVSHTYESQRMSIENKLNKLAYEDALTGAQNRLALKHRFSQLSQPDQPRAYLAILDVDHFKHINDTHGHDIGDQVLINLTQKLQHHYGVTNVFRLGGEEFCMLLNCSSLESATTLCDQVRQKIQAVPLVNDEVLVSITVSIGVCELKQGFSLNQGLKVADTLLYDAKALGRNQVLAA